MQYCVSILLIVTFRITNDFAQKYSNSRTEENTERTSLKKTIIGKVDYTFYCCDNGNDFIYQISKTGEIVWSYPAANPQDIWVLPSGNILFTYHHGENGKGGVTEVTKDKQVIF